MTHFVRFAMIGAMVAGASVCALAQDESVDDLLGDLIAEDVGAEATEVQAEADEPAEEIADEPVEVSESPADEVAEDPAEEEVEPEVEADESAEPEAEPEPEVEAETEVAEEPAGEEPVAEEPADEPVAEEEPAAEEPVEPEPEVAEEEPAEEAVAEEPQEEVLEEPTVGGEEEPAEVASAEEPIPEEPAQALNEEDVGQGGIVKGEGKPLIEGIGDDSSAVAELTEEEKALNDLEMLIQLKNKGLDAHAVACLQRARKLMDPTNPPPPGKAFEQYAEAIKMYDAADTYFRQREANLPLKAECDRGKTEARYRQANALFLNKQYKEALDLAQQVTREGHPHGAALQELIQTERNRPAEIVANPILPEYAKDEYKTKRLAIQERIRRATVYFHLSKYKEANDQLELVLREDPDNEAAINLRARITQRKDARHRELGASTHTEMIGQVSLAWTPLNALGRDCEELYNPEVSRGKETKVDDSGAKDTETVLAKLENIRLPEFSIRPPSTLADAVQIFAELSRAYDKPELPPEERGISFVLNLGSAPAAAASDDSERDFFASDDTSSSSGLPPIQSISMTFVTLKEALENVCDVTHTKYVVKGKIVQIVPLDFVVGDMETRSYNVMSSIDERVNQVSSEMSSGGGDGDSWAMDSGSSSDTGSGSTSESWKKLFMDLGVPFEGKASLVYLKSIGKIRVTNTPENLALFEKVLEELNVTPFQIEVEARFVEVSQEDLNSLGFEWQLNSDVVGTIGSGIDWASSQIKGNPYGGTAAGGIGAGGNNVFRPSTKSGTGDANVALHGGSLNNGMRFLGDSDLYANRVNLSGSKLAPNDEFASFSAVFGRVDMTMILHMLSQRSDTDMLSSPKVVTRNGFEALMKVVTNHIYPTEFDVEEMDIDMGDDSTATIPLMNFTVEPQSFETQEVGYSLQVMPEVSQEGQMINLTVAPKVVEYLGDFDYGISIPYLVQNYVGDMKMGAPVREEYFVSMPQPKFHIREVNTSLSIYNGSTVVMGGLITETRKSFEDKVPLLGDLPFIGFLFRSTGEYSEKRNLLIFLSARLVDPAGRPIKTATDGRTGASAMDKNQNTMSSTIN